MPDFLTQEADVISTSKLSADEIVTLVIKHRVKAGLEAEYEAWLRRIVAIASTYDGHLGVDIIRGKSEGLHMFTCVVRFCSVEVMQGWLDSEERRQLVIQAEPMLADGDVTEVERHSEFWFVPATDAPPPPRWKQAVVTFFVICPLTLMIPLLWQPIFSLNVLFTNYILSTALVTVTIVLLVVYLLMPFATRIAAPWLNAKATPKGSGNGHEG